MQLRSLKLLKSGFSTLEIIWKIYQVVHPFSFFGTHLIKRQENTTKNVTSTTLLLTHSQTTENIE